MLPFLLYFCLLISQIEEISFKNIEFFYQPQTFKQ